jgi:hypothetical protein
LDTKPGAGVALSRCLDFVNFTPIQHLTDVFFTVFKQRIWVMVISRRISLLDQPSAAEPIATVERCGAHA